MNFNIEFDDLFKFHKTTHSYTICIVFDDLIGIFVLCFQDLAKELEQLRKLLLDTRKAHEDETLCRIDLENTLQSYREELLFKDQVLTSLYHVVCVRILFYIDYKLLFYLSTSKIVKFA